MTTPLCAETVVAVGIILALLLVLFIVSPLLAISFEAGLLVGVLLHSSHSKTAEENGFVEYL